MSWMSQLYQTYEKNAVSSAQEDIRLTPIAHMYAKAQIEVTVNKIGEFISTSKIEKNQATTLIPVTESSAGRASGIAPHPLSDTLSYLAGDFPLYCRQEKIRKLSGDKYQCYIENLQKWVESPDSHWKATAIYQYLSQKKLIANLINAGMINLEEDGLFCEEKISGQSYEKVLVRFRVVGGDDETDTTWEDESLIQSYLRFYIANQEGRRDICYLTGKETVISKNHPKGIVAANYGAKLVSANDAQGYTFRGKFQNAEQACALGYESSQKIHSALTWLVKKQGAYVGSTDIRTFVCWNPQGKKTPDILDALGFPEEEDNPVADAPKYKKKIFKLLQGYQNQFTPNEQIMVMGMDAATTGRLSITYYNEFFAYDFFEKIILWGATCHWYMLRFTEKKKPYYVVNTPMFRRIVEYAFGSEQGNFIEVSDKVLKEQIQRLLKCMLEGEAFPKDIVNALVLRASTPLAYSKSNREHILEVACAVIIKYYHDRKKGVENTMKLDLQNQDRSYLFGRLLAVYEQIEKSAYRQAGQRGEERETNAIRYQAAYTNHPMQTRMILEDVVRPYFSKLRFFEREKYRNLIGEITLLFLEEDQGYLNQRLGESYLLGYYLQRAEFYKKKENQKEDEENETVTE